MSKERRWAEREGRVIIYYSLVSVDQFHVLCTQENYISHINSGRGVRQYSLFQSW